jgi:hypothetical protein
VKERASTRRASISTPRSAAVHRGRIEVGGRMLADSLDDSLVDSLGDSLVDSLGVTGKG